MVNDSLEGAKMPEDKTPNVAPSRPTKGIPDEPGPPKEVEAVTGRPADVAPDNSTFAGRAKERAASEKRIASSQNKAVQSAKTK